MEPGPPTGTIPAPTGEIAMIEDLRLGVDDPLFGSIITVAVDAAGAMYVADFANGAYIHKFSAEGDHVGFLGTSGEGPGEFQTPNAIVIQPDSIVVFDGRRSLLHVYETDGSHRRDVGRIDSPARTRINILGGAGGQYVAQQAGSYSLGITPDEVADTAFRIMDGNGVLGDTIWTSRPLEVLLHSTKDYVAFKNRPHGRRPYCAVSDANLYCVWSDDLVFRGFTLSGDSLATVAVEYSPVRVSASEKLEAREGVSEDFRDQLVVPDTRPALDGLIADDAGRLWARVTLTPDDETTTYWIINPADQSAESAMFNGNVYVYRIRDGRVYAALRSPDGEQFVVRYRYE